MHYRMIIVAVVSTVVLCGCASNRERYDWGGYNASLYAYYKDPTRAAELEASLQRIVNDSSRGHRPVPPGVYAELGGLKLAEGASREAVAAFQLEKSHWPESSLFMDRMIRLATTDNTSATGADKP